MYQGSVIYFTGLDYDKKLRGKDFTFIWIDKYEDFQMRGFVKQEHIDALQTLKEGRVFQHDIPHLAGVYWDLWYWDLAEYQGFDNSYILSSKGLAEIGG